MSNFARELLRHRMKLVILTSSTFFVEEDKILVTLFEEGLERLHLYKPGASPIYMERLLSLLPSSYYSRIVVHGHLYLQNEYNLGGAHLDELSADMSLVKGKVGRTCYSIESLPLLKKNASQVFLHAFAQGVDSMPMVGTSDLIRASHLGVIDKRVFLSGALNFEHISIAKDLGFGGIVFQDELWNTFNIHQHTDFKKLIAHFHKLRKAVG